jgi:hypothetical protein
MLYMASCSVLIATTVGFRGAIDILRSYTAPAAAAAAEIPATATRSAAPPSPVSSAETQRKKSDPELREYRLPIGTPVFVVLRTGIDSATSQVDDQVDAELSQPVVQDDVELIPEGSVVHGRVVGVVPAAGKKIRGQITVKFEVVQHAETKSRAAMPTRSLTFEADPPARASAGRKRDAPMNVALPAGSPLVLTLSEPLVVFIPKR